MEEERWTAVHRMLDAVSPSLFRKGRPLKNIHHHYFYI